MAVLEQIRKNTKLTLFLVGGAILAFVATDSLQYCNPKPDTDTIESVFIGSVSGVDISDRFISSYNNTQISELNEYLKFVKRGQGNQNDGPGNMQSFTIGLTQQYEDVKSEISKSENGYSTEEIDSIMRSFGDTYNTYMQEINSYGNDVHIDPKSFFLKKSWDDFINLYVLSEKAKSIGIKIPNNQINAFKSQSQTLQSRDFSEEILLRNTYLKLLEKGSFSSHIDSILISKSKNVSIRYVKVPYTLNNNIDVLEEEIERYYQNNISSYQSDVETRAIEYILFNMSPSEKDEEFAYQTLLNKKNDIIKGTRKFNERAFNYKSIEKINAEYLELIKKDNDIYVNEDSILGPYKSSKDYFKIASLSDVMYQSDIVDINYLRFKLDSNLTDSIANIKANIIKDQIRNGENFKLLSKQTANNKNIIFGNIQKFSSDNLSELNLSEIEIDSIMFAKEGGVLTVANDNDIYLVEIENIISQSPICRIYVDSSKISVSKETDSIIRNQAEYILTKTLKETNVSLKEIAEGEDLYYNKISGINSTTFNLSPVLRDSRNVVNWIFDNSTELGDISSDYFECDRNRKLLVVKLLSENPIGTMSFEDVKNEIIDILTIQKQYDKLEDLLSKQTSLEDIIRVFPDLEIMESKNLNMSQTELFSGIIGAANSLSIGAISKPIKGDDALYFISLLDKKLIDNNQYQNIMSKQDIDKKIDVVSYQKNLFTISLLQSILNDESIVDNRYLIED